MASLVRREKKTIESATNNYCNKKGFKPFSFAFTTGSDARTCLTYADSTRTRSTFMMYTYVTIITGLLSWQTKIYHAKELVGKSYQNLAEKYLP